MQLMWLLVPDTNSHRLVVLTWILAWSTCSKKYDFLQTVCCCKASPLTPIHSNGLFSPSPTPKCTFLSVFIATVIIRILLLHMIQFNVRDWCNLHWSNFHWCNLHWCNLHWLQSLPRYVHNSRKRQLYTYLHVSSLGHLVMPSSGFRVASSPGHSQISPRLRDKIWEWPGDRLVSEFIWSVYNSRKSHLHVYTYGLQKPAFSFHIQFVLPYTILGKTSYTMT